MVLITTARASYGRRYPLRGPWRPFRTVKVAGTKVFIRAAAAAAAVVVLCRCTVVYTAVTAGNPYTPPIRGLPLRRT